MSEALAPHPPAERAVNSDGAAAADDGGHDGLIGLLYEIAGEAEGIDIVYEALDLVAARFRLTDAIVSVEDVQLGFQAFALERRPVGPAELDRLRAGESFISEPDVVPQTVKRLVTGLAAVALGTQLARRNQIRDPLSGLLSRAVFNEALRSAAAQSSRYGWTFTVMVLRVGAEPEPSDAEVRRFGHAFARALRSGDTGGRLRGVTFMALLPNASSESAHALVRRFLEESGVSAEGLDHGSATAPNESVDPAELFRLAGSRVGNS